jgi:hypothetical protein
MRHKKEVLYRTKQLEIRRIIFNLLKLDEQQSITLVELDKDLETQHALMELLPQIRQYFSVSKIPTLAKPEQAERPWLAIIKHILSHDYDIFPKTIHQDGICSMRYFFRKKTT